MDYEKRFEENMNQNRSYTDMSLKRMYNKVAAKSKKHNRLGPNKLFTLKGFEDKN